MQVLLLAAGRSRRIQPVEDKNFISFLGKPLIEHQLGLLHDLNLQDITVVGGAHNLTALRGVAEQYGAKVVEQKNLDEGMAGAILALEPNLSNEPLLIVNSNDVVEPKAFHAILDAQEGDGAILAVEQSSYFPGGYLTVEGDRITQIVEKPEPGTEPSNLINVVIHRHNSPAKLMQALHAATSDRDDRYEVALQELFNALDYRAIPYNGSWQAIKYPWHVLDLNEHFLKGIKRDIHPTAHIAETAVIRGEVVLEEGVKVMDNAVIQGPATIGKNTVIGMGALVRNSMIGADSVIGFSTEIARSHVGARCWFHSNYVGDTVMGDDCSFGAGAVLANLRLDEKPIKESGRIKLGPILGSRIRVGVNTSIMPGIRIGSDTMIGSGLTLAQDIEPKKFVTGKTELKIEDNRAILDPSARDAMKQKL